MQSFLLTGDLIYRLGILFCSGSRRISETKNFKGAQGTMMLTLARHFAAGIFYRHLQGGGFTIGLKELKVTDIYGDLSFTYFQPSSYNHVLNSNRMEIMLRAFLNPEE